MSAQEVTTLELGLGLGSGLGLGLGLGLGSGLPHESAGGDKDGFDPTPLCTSSYAPGDPCDGNRFLFSPEAPSPLAPATRPTTDHPPSLISCWNGVGFWCSVGVALSVDSMARDVVSPFPFVGARDDP